MYDILPFPNIVAGSVEEQTAQINNYLIQLKETLEFVLTNISIENLSQDLVFKLNNIGVETTSEESYEQMQQVVSKTLSVSDVVNSYAFSLAVNSIVNKTIPNEMAKIKFTVNFDTGNLEYTTSKES